MVPCRFVLQINKKKKSNDSNKNKLEMCLLVFLFSSLYTAEHIDGFRIDVGGGASST